MITFVTAFGGSWLAIAWLLATVLPRPYGARSAWLVAGSMGLGLAYGLLSLIYFGWRFVFGSTGPVYFGFEAAVIVGVGGVAWWRRRRSVPKAPHGLGPLHDRSSRSPSLWLAGGFGLLTIAVTAGFVFRTLWIPLGTDDALAIWNLKARFLFHIQDDNHWLFQRLREATLHGGYPLLLPITVARGWSALGHESVWVPAGVAFAFTAGAVALAAALVGSLRGPTQGLLAGLTLGGSSLLMKHGASQYADVPMAYFILMALGALAIYFESGQSSRAVLVLVGLAGGLCAWTKNEGVLFAAVVPVAHFLGTRGNVPLGKYAAQACWLGLGLIPILLVVAYFKLALAVGDELITAQGTSTWERLCDPSRAWQIAKAYVSESWYVTKAFVFVLPVYWFLVGGRTRQGESSPAVRCSLIAIGLMLSGFFLVYMATPYPLDWHLSSSLSRLMLQLWPATVAVFFLAAASPGDIDERRTTRARAVSCREKPASRESGMEARGAPGRQPSLT